MEKARIELGRRTKRRTTATQKKSYSGNVAGRRRVEGSRNNPTMDVPPYTTDILRIWGGYNAIRTKRTKPENGSTASTGSVASVYRTAVAESGTVVHTQADSGVDNRTHSPKVRA